MRRRRIGAVVHQLVAGRQRPLAVHRLAHRIDDPSEPAAARPHAAGRAADDGAAAAPQPLDRSERHHQRGMSGKAHDLTRHEAPGRHLDVDEPAHMHARQRPGDLDHQAAHAGHAPIGDHLVQIAEIGADAVESRASVVGHLRGRNDSFTPPVNNARTELACRLRCRPAGGERRVARIGCRTSLKWHMSSQTVRFRSAGNILGRFVKIGTNQACGSESGFVNHCPVAFRVENERMSDRISAGLCRVPPADAGVADQGTSLET